MKVGDLFFALHADGARFSAEAQAEAQKAGDAAGKTLGARIARSAKLALKGGLTFLSAGAALATKGMLELDDAVAQFQADTGATAEEAKAARVAINEMSSRNLQPVKEIGAALAKVRTDMGLTGKEAEDTTEAFLHFAEATGQDAAESVLAFDDILDNWGLTAADSQEIMDKLIVSHQKYGGAIDKNQATLAKLAPAMRAANFEIDDAIALIGLFGSKGLDADQATAAFSKALTKVKSPEELQRLIDDIAATEDPFQRAEKAAQLFGARAGAKLANALGGVDFKSYAIGVDEARGATEKAAAAITSTWGARAQLFFKNVTAGVVGLGSSFGPVLTGLASFVSLAGALGGTKLGEALAGGLGKVLAKAGVSDLISTAVKGGVAKAGVVVGGVFERAFAGAAKLGRAVGGAFDAIASSGLVKRAAAKVGAIWTGAMLVASKVGSALADVFTKLPGMGMVRSAVLGSAIKIGTLQGTAMGTAAGAAFRLAMVGAIAGIANEIAPAVVKMGRDLGDQLRPSFLSDIGRAWSDWRKNTDWPLGQKNAPDWAKVGTETKEGTQGISDAALAGVKPMEELPGKVADDLRPIPAIVGAASEDTAAAFAGMGEAADDTADDIEGDTVAVGKATTNMWGVVVPKVSATADAWKQYRKDTKAAQDQALSDQLGFTSKALADLIGYESGVEDTTSGVYNAEHDAQVTKNRIIILQDQLSQARADHVAKGKKISAAEQADFENNRIAIEGEMQALQLHLAMIGDDIHRESKLQALLTSKDMRAGLTSQNANVRLSFESQRDKIIAALVDIQKKGGPAANAAGKELKKWLDPSNPLSPLHGSGLWGSNAGNAYIRGLTTSLSKDERIRSALLPIRGILFASSPPGPASPLHFIDKWAERTGAVFPASLAGGIIAGIGRVSAAVGRVAAPLMAPFGAPSIGAPNVALGASSQGVAVGTSGTVAAPSGGNQYVLNVHGDIRAPDEASVLRTLQRLSAVTVPA